MEDVDEYEDFVEELSSGVQDIIITGEVGSLALFIPVLVSSTAWVCGRRVKNKEKHGDTTHTLGEFGPGTVWSSSFVFRYVTRLFSAFCSQSLITDQMNNQFRDTGRWIFKGYVHERSLVGRWRETATDEHAVGFEGGFVLCQEDEVNTASRSMFA